MSRPELPVPAEAPGRPQGLRRSGRLPDIDPQRCTGCGRCVAACEPHVLSLELVRWKKSAVLHAPDRCTGCSLCAVKCPFHAIAMQKLATGAAALQAPRAAEDPQSCRNQPARIVAMSEPPVDPESTSGPKGPNH